jgi:hypothetical protein
VPKIPLGWPCVRRDADDFPLADKHKKWLGAYLCILITDHNISVLRYRCLGAIRDCGNARQRENMNHCKAADFLAVEPCRYDKAKKMPEERIWKVLIFYRVKMRGVSSHCIEMRRSVAIWYSETYTYQGVTLFTPSLFTAGPEAYRNIWCFFLNRQLQGIDLPIILWEE